MSLAVPYLIAAAAESHPDAVIDVAGTDLDCAELDRRTLNAARELCSTEHPVSVLIPSGGLCDASSVCAALGAMLVGIPLSDRPDDRDEPRVDADVRESQVWSAVVAARVGGDDYDHGTLLAGRRTATGGCQDR